MPLYALELTTATLFLLASLKSDSPHPVCSQCCCQTYCSFMFNQLHWLPLSARIKLKIVALVLKSKLGVAPKYLEPNIRSPLSATSHRPLRSFDRQVPFVLRVRSIMAQTRSFATIGMPSLPLFA